MSKTVLEELHKLGLIIQPRSRQTCRELQIGGNCRCSMLTVDAKAHTQAESRLTDLRKRQTRTDAEWRALKKPRRKETSAGPFCVMKGSCSTTRNSRSAYSMAKRAGTCRSDIFSAQTRADEIEGKLEELAGTIMQLSERRRKRESERQRKYHDWQQAMKQLAH